MIAKIVNLVVVAVLIVVGNASPPNSFSQIYFAVLAALLAHKLIEVKP